MSGISDDIPREAKWFPGDLPVPEAPLLGTAERDIWDRGFVTGCNETQANLKSWAEECIRQAAAAARASERENIRRQFLDVVTGNMNEGNDIVYGALLDAIRELGSARTPQDATGSAGQRRTPGTRPEAASGAYSPVQAQPRKEPSC